MNLTYGKIAGIDVHKKWLYVVTGEQRRRVGSTVSELNELCCWLKDEKVKTVVMESTAQYWRPVWIALIGEFELYLAQAQSNRARQGRKTDFLDAERLVRRLEANELVLSFVPDTEQQEWRMLTRKRVECANHMTRVRNHIETLLEQSRIKISGNLTDLLGVSGRRMLAALAAGESDPERLASLADFRLRASKEELTAALTGHMTLCGRLLLKQNLEQIELLDRHMEELSQALADCLKQHWDAIERLCEIPGIGINAAEQIIAELGPAAATFPSPRHVASWIGVCPGRQESAGVSRADTSPKGNRPLRRVLTQVAWAAVRTKGSFFQALFRKLTPRLGTQKALWAVAHRLSHVLWIVLHRKEHYRELGPIALNPRSMQSRLRKMIRQLTSLGYAVVAPHET
jgi:transposase